MYLRYKNQIVSVETMTFGAIHPAFEDKTGVKHPFAVFVNGKILTVLRSYGAAKDIFDQIAAHLVRKDGLINLSIYMPFSQVFKIVKPDDVTPHEDTHPDHHHYHHHHHSDDKHHHHHHPSEVPPEIINEPPDLPTFDTENSNDRRDENFDEEGPIGVIDRYAPRKTKDGEIIIDRYDQFAPTVKDHPHHHHEPPKGEKEGKVTESWDELIDWFGAVDEENSVTTESSEGGAALY